VSRRVMGWVIVAVGAAVVVLSAAADPIGLSHGGSARLFGYRQILGIIAGALALAIGLSLALGIGRRRAAPPSPGHRWYVSEPGADLMNSPIEGEVLGQLAAGTAVIERARQGDLLQIEVPDGRTGWINRSEVF
jgi:hypothetical protein